MPALTPIPFTDLLRRMRREAELCRSIFDLPRRKWFLPPKDLDFSARHFSHRASTPVGPAAGPHTQLAQNLVLSWLAGGRILELKTVQVNDRLAIPRPCIHIPNVGYNVEWSQELAVSESVREYAKAAYLIEILKQTRGFGVFGRRPVSGLTSVPTNNAGTGWFGCAHHRRELQDSGGDTVYDTSVGYDVRGIRSDKVTGFLRALQNPTPHFDELRAQLTGDLREFRDVDLPSLLSDCVTLSTFHGCPANEIEDMVRYLLEELRFHVIIKFNPTLLGFEAVRELLHERLGYHHLALRREAFEQDLHYDDGLEMLRRLNRVAEGVGLQVGAKFTNTLVVVNNPQFFPTQADPYMYLSGQPLHVIAMNLMQRFREDLGFEFPVSFSAGIDKTNFPAAVACGMVPVTTCTDLLRPGGYARLPHYLDHLGEQMRRCGVTSREAYVLGAKGHGAQAVRETLESVPGGAQVWAREAAQLSAIAEKQPNALPDALRKAVAAAGLDAEAILLHATRAAGRLNGRDIVPTLADDARYCAQANTKEPPRVKRTLQLYDCINCDLCISACPNDAIFAYEATPGEVSTELLRIGPQGELRRAPGEGFAIRERHQLAVVANLCNECSNCDVYCPEQGAPFQLKERVFVGLDDFRRASQDGFCREGRALHVRLAGLEMLFVPEPESNRASIQGRNFRLELSWSPFAVREARATDGEGVSLDTSFLWRMRMVWEFIFHSSKPNMVNPDPAASGRMEAAR